MGNHKLEKLKAAYKAEHYADPNIRIGYDSRRFDISRQGMAVCYSAEASDLEIPVGIVPKEFYISGPVEIGPFKLVSSTDKVWDYVVPNTLQTAQIFND